MEILNVKPNTEEWMNERFTSTCASEVPIIMGVSPYVDREELLKYKKSGVSPIISSYQQKIFDSGHESEALARPIVEEEIGEDLFQIVAVRNVEGLKNRMLASYDGLTMFYEIGFEHKDYNKELFENVRHKVLPEDKIYQLEAQIFVSGDECKSVEFVCSDGTDNPDKRAKMTYTSNPEYREKMLAGIKRFEKDLEEYEVKAIPEKIVTEKRAALPMVQVQTSGEVVIISNLEEFREDAIEFVDSIKTELVTQSDFEQASVDIKALKTAEDQLTDAEERILNSYPEIMEVRGVISELKEFCSKKRLTNNKQVELRKKERREEIVKNAQLEVDKYYTEAVAELRGYSTPPLNYNFIEAIKGKSNFDNMVADVKTILANVKIEIDGHCERMSANLKSLDESAAGFEFLFNDFHSLINLEPEHALLSINDRVQKHKEAEAKKQEIRDKISKIRGFQDIECCQLPEENIKYLNNQIASLSLINVNVDFFGEFTGQAKQVYSDSMNALVKARDSYQEEIDERLQAEEELGGNVEAAEEELAQVQVEDVVVETAAGNAVNYASGGNQNLTPANENKKPRVVTMGNIYTVDNPDDDCSEYNLQNHPMALVIEFNNPEEIREAIRTGKVEFELFGG